MCDCDTLLFIGLSQLVIIPHCKIANVIKIVLVENWTRSDLIHMELMAFHQHIDSSSSVGLSFLIF